jgi:guanylate kinase
MSHFNEFDYLVINDDFSSALTDLKLIISSSKNLTKCTHLSLEEQSIKHKKLLKKLI